jgi:hypothetical protein
MLATDRFGNTFIGTICLVLLLTSQSAHAATAEVAKKCAELMTKEFPPRVIGNPAAGSAKGTGRDEQQYFKQCIENGGSLSKDDATKTK